MPLTELFTDDLAVTAGNPTLASQYNNLSNNTDALKERIEINHFFNNTATANEDGYHKGDWSDPVYFYAKATGGHYAAMWLSNDLAGNIHFRVKVGATKAAATPGSEGDGVAIGIGDFV